MKNPGLLITIVCMVLISTAFGAWDHTPRPLAVPDLTAFLIQVPAAEIQKHGNSDRTTAFYNLAKILEAYRALETRVKVLEGKVKELEAKAAEDGTEYGSVRFDYDGTRKYEFYDGNDWQETKRPMLLPNEVEK